MTTPFFGYDTALPQELETTSLRTRSQLESAAARIRVEPGTVRDGRCPVAGTDRIRAVFLDFGGVIATEGFREGLTAIAERHGIDPEDLHRIAYDATYESGYVTGRGTQREFWDLIRKRFPIEGPDEELAEELMFLRKSTGAVPGPMDCWLTLRGLKTLHVRMRQHNANGMVVARFLEAHPKVGRVLYPGLPSHPQHDLAARQMDGFTGMVSVDVGTLERARALTEHCRVFALAESLGGIESLISVPALMTHASVPEERRAAMGITPGLVRLSVGIEDEVDIIQDLERVLG